MNWEQIETFGKKRREILEGRTRRRVITIYKCKDCGAIKSKAEVC